MSLSGRVRQGAFLQLGARLFSAGATFVLTAVVLARVLSKAEYGLFSFYLTMFLIAVALIDFGANRAAIRIIAAKEAPREPVLCAAIAFKACCGAAAFLVICAVIFLAEQGLVPRLLLALAALHTLTHACGGASVAFEADLDFRVPALSLVFGYTLFLAAGLALVFLDVRSAPPYLLAWGAGSACQNLLLFALAARRGLIARRGAGAVLGKLAREAFPLGVSAAAVSVYFYADVIMLRPLRGEADVADYRAASSLMSFGLMVPVLFCQVLFPIYVRCHNRSALLLGAIVRRSTFYLALFGSTGAALLIGLAPDLLALVFGEPYRGAASSLRLLGAAMLLVFLTFPHTTALIAAGRAAVFTRITLASVVLNIGLNLLVLRRFGPEGAAATTLATEAFVLGAGVLSLRRALGVTGVSRELFGPLLLGGALFLGLVLFGAGRPLFVTLPVALAAAGLGALLLRALPFRLGVEEEEIA
ncbi:MAG: oligosaccharide flippase family protein [Planctomycetes bacterium]|nr:oligosaccharide flippase family protein [Planctomycetota bacterium]